MRAFYMVLIVSILSSAVDCEGSEVSNHQNWRFSIPYGELDINALASESSSIEDAIHKSLQTTKNVFSELSSYTKVGALMTKFIPVAGELLDLANSFTDILADETDWKNDHENVLADQIRKAVGQGKVDEIAAFLRMVQKYTPFLNATLDQMMENNQ